jgi:hypothetical protein
MEDLMTLNIFAYSPAATLIGVVLFGGLLALPLYYDGEPRPTPPAACCARPAERRVAMGREEICNRLTAWRQTRCASTTSR